MAFETVYKCDYCGEVIPERHMTITDVNGYSNSHVCGARCACLILGEDPNGYKADKTISKLKDELEKKNQELTRVIQEKNDLRLREGILESEALLTKREFINMVQRLERPPSEGFLSLFTRLIRGE
jgi:hypothetical protein